MQDKYGFMNKMSEAQPSQYLTSNYPHNIGNEKFIPYNYVKITARTNIPNSYVKYNHKVPYGVILKKLDLSIK